MTLTTAALTLALTAGPGLGAPAFRGAVEDTPEGAEDDAERRLVVRDAKGGIAWSVPVAYPAGAHVLVRADGAAALYVQETCKDDCGLIRLHRRDGGVTALDSPTATMHESAFIGLDEERYGWGHHGWLLEPPTLRGDAVVLLTRDLRRVTIRLTDGSMTETRVTPKLPVGDRTVELPGFFPAWGRGPDSLGDGGTHGVQRVPGTEDAEAVARARTDFERLDSQEHRGRTVFASTGSAVVFCTVPHRDAVYIFSVSSTTRETCADILARKAFAPVVEALFEAEP